MVERGYVSIGPPRPHFASVDEASADWAIAFENFAERRAPWAAVNEFLAFRMPELLTPSWFVVQFLGIYLEGRDASLLVDPACTGAIAMFGSLVEGVGAEGDITRRGICHVERPDLARGLKAFERDNIEWLSAGASGPEPVAPAAAEALDLIVSMPPVNMPAETRSYETPEGERVDVSDSRGVLTLLTAAQMAEGGEALFLLPHSFLSRTTGSKRVRSLLHRFGLHVHACVELVSPLRSGSGINLNLVSIRREPVDQVWVGQLSRQADLSRFADSMRARRVGRMPEQGRLVDWSSYRGFGPMAAREEFQRRVSRTGASVVPLAELLTKPVRPPRHARDAVIEVTPNTVYLPTYVTAKVLSSHDAAGVRASGRFALSLDPERALADYVAAVLNDDLGLLLRRSISGGQVIESIRSSRLPHLEIPLPSMAVQRRFVELRQRLNEVRVSVETLERRLLNKPGEVDSLARQLRHVGSEDPLGAWLDVLPFPLASILRRYQADGEIERKVEHCLRFFEACAEFFASVLLSPFLADDSLREREVSRWTDENGRIPLARASFGSWTTFGAAMAASTRRLLSERESADRMLSALCVSGEAFRELISGKSLWTALHLLTRERNEDAHGGIRSAAEREQKLARLEIALTELRLLTAEALSEVQLIRPGEGAYRNGINRYRKAERLSGASETFLQEPLESIVQLETDALYLVDRTEEPARTALKLAPFVQLLAAPASEKRAAYFYSRLGKQTAEYISHHFEDAAHIEVDAQDVSKVFEQLVSPQTGS